MIDPELSRDMIAKGIDIDLSLSMLENINAGLYDVGSTVDVAGVPPVDGTLIVPAGAGMCYTVDHEAASARLVLLGLVMPAGAVVHGSTVTLDRPALVDLGERLYAQTAWGVLNGGSATSYADSKKNRSLGAGVFEAVEPWFNRLAPLCQGRPKGVTPAYINLDGSPGASFIMLKMRAALLCAARYVDRFGKP